MRSIINEEFPSPPEEVPIPTPFPDPEVTDITAEQERRNNIAAAMRKQNEAYWNGIAALEEMEALNPTPSEIRRAIDDLRI